MTRFCNNYQAYSVSTGNSNPRRVARTPDTGERMITIIVEGPDHAGKSHEIALIAKLLKKEGCNVAVQAEETHNAGTLAMTEAAQAPHLSSAQIIIKEMRTSA